MEAEFDWFDNGLPDSLDRRLDDKPFDMVGWASQARVLDAF